MALGRFDLTPVFRGHVKGLTRADRNRTAADFLARVVLFGVPVGVAVLMFVTDAGLSAPESLLTGVAILLGGNLAVFGALSTLRLRLTETADDFNQAERDGLDESVAHLLAAAIACVVTAVVLVVGMNLRVKPTMAELQAGAPGGSELTGLPAAIAGGLSTYIALIFLILIPRLYYAYTSINVVRHRMSGYHRGRPFDED